MFSRWICGAALTTALCGAAAAQAPEDDRRGSNVIKRLPGYVRLLPRAPAPGDPVVPGKWRPAAVESKVDCAHILIAPVSPEIDPGIEVKVDPRRFSTPVYRGIPGCAEDRR